MRRVLIPKPGGGERPLGIPTIRDRVVQTAAKLVLEPIFEAEFDPSAYGYRPRRSAQDAVRAVHRALCDGDAEVVDADLSKYFFSFRRRTTKERRSAYGNRPLNRITANRPQTPNPDALMQIPDCEILDSTSKHYQIDIEHYASTTFTCRKR